ncbi:DUF4199 domain-containing protein [Flavobacterium sp.]|uniref:DUF4199 domain-containing protein n=1 Tax=Flavobacterium sp. TaxID=239 RepID=UPI00262B4ACC|nr:DUF4199 domain-containing protein [Flavobacterium sp.]
MNENKSAAKSGLNYGLLFGAIMILEFVIGYVMNIDPQTNPTYGTIINVSNFLILPFVFIYLGCNNYKTNINGGFVSFGECLKIGVTICVIAGLLSGIFMVVFNLILPEYMTEMYDKVGKMMVEKNPELTSEQIEMSISMIKKFSHPAILLPVTVLMYAFIGLIHSLIVGAIVKKDRNQGF